VKLVKLVNEAGERGEEGGSWTGKGLGGHGSPNSFVHSFIRSIFTLTGRKREGGSAVRVRARKEGRKVQPRQAR